MDNNSEFIISGAGNIFVSRSKNVFADLDKIEANHENYLKNPEIITDSLNLMKPDPGQEDYIPDIRKKKKDNFKIPSGLPLKNNVQLPRDMSKWTEYSLTDVLPSQMSEGANILASYDVLKRNYSKISTESADNDPIGVETNEVKHIFKKPLSKNAEIDKNACKTHKIQKVSLHFDETDDKDENVKEKFAKTDSINFIKKVAKNKNSRTNLDDSDEEECNNDDNTVTNNSEKDDDNDEDEFSDLKDNEDDDKDEDRDFDNNDVDDKF